MNDEHAGNFKSKLSTPKFNHDIYFDGSLKSSSEVPALFLSKKHLSITLGISVSYVDKLMADEGLPHYKIGRSVRFNLNEIMAFLERRKRP